MLRDCGFHLYSTGVFSPEKATLHLPPVLRFWPFATVRARIELDDGQADVQAFSRKFMIFLAVETGIAESRVDLDVTHSVFQQRAPQDAVIAGSSRDSSRHDQMRQRFTDDPQLGPIALAARLCAYARLVMFAGMAFFKTGGINRDAGGVLKESRHCKPAPKADRTRRGKVG